MMTSPFTSHLYNITLLQLQTPIPNQNINILRILILKLSRIHLDPQIPKPTFPNNTSSLLRIKIYAL